MPKQYLKLGPFSVTVRKCLNNASNWAFPSYCQKIPQQCLEMRPSSINVRKCLNNASNWGFPQLLSDNAFTMPRNEAFLSYCEKMPKQCLEWNTSFHFPSEYLPILQRHTPTSFDSWQRVHRKVRKSSPRFLQFLEHWRHVTLLQLMCCDWYNYHCLFLAHGGAVVWGTALRAERSRVRFFMVSLEFSIDIILPAVLWSWGWLSL
jgi:hypothetical protein